MSHSFVKMSGLFAATIVFAAALVGCGDSTNSSTDSSANEESKSMNSTTSEEVTTTQSVTATSLESSTTLKASDTTNTSATTSKNTTTVNKVTLNYSLANVKSLDNFTYTVEITENGKTTTPYRISRTKTRIKVEWLFENTDGVLGTVEYLDKNDKHFDGKYYSKLKFYSNPAGANTNYKGNKLKSPYMLWEEHDVTSLLNSSTLQKGETVKIGTYDTVVYTASGGGKTHKIYYNQALKTWLQYEIFNGKTLESRYTAKDFSVGNVTNEQAAWPTKSTGRADLPGYALLNMSSMVSED